MHSEAHAATGQQEARYSTVQPLRNDPSMAEWYAVCYSKRLRAAGSLLSSLVPFEGTYSYHYRVRCQNDSHGVHGLRLTTLSPT